MPILKRVLNISFIYGAGIDTFALFGNIAKKGMIFSCGDLRQILLTDVC